MIENAKGNGQSECVICKKQGKYSLSWTSFMYRVSGFDGILCYHHALEKDGEINGNSNK